MYMYMYVCTGAHEGQKFESQKEQQTRLSFLLLLKKFIHLLTGIIIIYILVQTSKLATWQKRLMYSPAGLLVRHIMK